MAYVDQKVQEALQNAEPKPAQLEWLYKGETGSSKPTDGTFKVDGDYIRLSFITKNGVDMKYGLWSDTSVSIDNGPVGCIWWQQSGSEQWKLKQQFRINWFRWNYNGHMEFRRSSRHGNSDSSLTVDNTYHITVGGFF